MRLLHLADLHLGWVPALPGDLAARRQAERDAVLERAVEYALGPGRIDLVVIAGDLFETHVPDDGLVARVLVQLRRLVAGGVGVVTVPGNHDEITYHNSVYRVRSGDWPGVLITQPMPQAADPLQAGGVPCHIYSLAYTGGLTRLPLTQFPRRDEPGLHIAVLHGSLDWDAGDRSLPLRSADLAAARYDYIALGHIHQYRQAQVGPGLAVYPGPAEGKGFADPGVGHLTVAHLQPGVPPRVETVPLPVRPVRSVTVDAGAFAGEGELLAALAALGTDQALQRFRLTGVPAFTISPAALAASLQARYFFLEIVDETEAMTPAAMAHLAQEATVRGVFMRRIRSRLENATDAAEQELLHRALRAGLAALAEGGGSR